MVEASKAALVAPLTAGEISVGDGGLRHGSLRSDPKQLSGDAVSASEFLVARRWGACR
jgi:hypothetical protein